MCCIMKILSLYNLGNVEARVICFYRRNEIPANLIPAADKHHWGEVDIDPVNG